MEGPRSETRKGPGPVPDRRTMSGGTARARGPDRAAHGRGARARHMGAAHRRGARAAPRQSPAVVNATARYDLSSSEVSVGLLSILSEMNIRPFP